DHALCDPLDLFVGEVVRRDRNARRLRREHGRWHRRLFRFGNCFRFRRGCPRRLRLRLRHFVRFLRGGGERRRFFGRVTRRGRFFFGFRCRRFPRQRLRLRRRRGHHLVERHLRERARFSAKGLARRFIPRRRLGCGRRRDGLRLRFRRGLPGRGLLLFVEAHLRECARLAAELFRGWRRAERRLALELRLRRRRDRFHGLRRRRGFRGEHLVERHLRKCARLSAEGIARRFIPRRRFRRGWRLRFRPGLRGRRHLLHLVEVHLRERARLSAERVGVGRFERHLRRSGRCGRGAEDVRFVAELLRRRIRAALRRERRVRRQRHHLGVRSPQRLRRRLGLRLWFRFGLRRVCGSRCGDRLRDQLFYFLDETLRLERLRDD